MNYLTTSTSTPQHNRTPRSFLIAVALVHILTQTQLETLQAAHPKIRFQQKVEDKPFTWFEWFKLTWWHPKCGLNNLGVEYEAKHEYQKAFQCYKGGAEGIEWGLHPIPMVHLARCYENGIGTEKDLKQAFAWYKKAADEQNWPEGMTGVAHCYDNGIGTEKDVKKATEYYEKVWHQLGGSFDSRYKKLFLTIRDMLVHRYIFGEGVAPDYNKAYAIGLSTFKGSVQDD